MVRPVSEGITVTILGRLFELVWDDDRAASHPCENCELRDEVCKASKDVNLMALCDYIVQEPNTFFIEKPIRA